MSAEAITQPKNAALAAQVATVFKGETLRGLLLNAYAFGTMGMIAGIAAFAAAAVMLILSGLGLMHARRVSPAAEIQAFAALTASPGPRLLRPPARSTPTCIAECRSVRVTRVLDASRTRTCVAFVCVPGDTTQHGESAQSS